MRLIDGDALKESFRRNSFKGNKFGEVFDAYIDNAPTIEERKKGKWMLDDKSGRYRCSECLSVASRDDHGAEVLSDYCGVCGARMEKA